MRFAPIITRQDKHNIPLFKKGFVLMPPCALMSETVLRYRPFAAERSEAKKRLTAPMQGTSESASCKTKRDRLRSDGDEFRMKMRHVIGLILLALMCTLIVIGCTDTTGSAGAVAVFDGNSRCRYCNKKITNDDIDTLSEHGNGICSQEIDFVDSATHLCNYCGKPYTYNAQSSHGMNVCVYSCASSTGHRVPSAGDHTPCEICGGWLCVSRHGEGICGTLEPTPVPASTLKPTSTSTPASELKSSDKTLRTFNATFPDGTVIDMKTVAARQNIIVTAQDSVYVKATTSDSKTTVSGDKGTLKLSLGKNSFLVTATAEDGTEAYFNFTITVNELTPTPTPTPAPTPIEIICPKCGNDVDAVSAHLMNCGHYSCDDSLPSQEDGSHVSGFCGEAGHYECDGKDHFKLDCSNANHHCGDGMTHQYCPAANCMGTLCDDDHYGKTCPNSAT